MKLILKRSQVLFHWCWRQTCNKLDRNFTHQRSKISWKTFLRVWMTRKERSYCMSQTEPEKAVSVQLKWPVCVRDICCPSVDCTSVFWFCNVLQLRCSSGHLLCFLLWFGVTGRGSQNYKSLYLFICHCVSTCPFFHAAALFPKLTNVLRLIEYDPLTAVWNNEASFPLHFLPQDGLSLQHFSPHQSA